MVDLNKEDSDRAYKESKIIKETLNTYSKNIKPDFNFIKPVEGIISSRYGKKRFINDLSVSLKTWLCFFYISAVFKKKY